MCASILGSLWDGQTPTRILEAHSQRPRVQAALVWGQNQAADLHHGYSFDDPHLHAAERRLLVLMEPPLSHRFLTGGSSSPHFWLPERGPCDVIRRSHDPAGPVCTLPVQRQEEILRVRVNQLVDACVCNESLPPSRGQTWVLQGLTQ